MKAYHWLKANMTAGSSHESPWTVGETRIATGPLVLCQNGYHHSPTLFDGLKYAPGPVLCLVEVDEDGPSDDTKGCSRSWTLLKAVNVERELRLLACRIAEDVLPLWETTYPTDLRPRQAIQTARRYANGQATVVELGATRAATWAAARAATWAATEAKYRGWINESLLAALKAQP